jgi:hypothetical protein
MKPTFTLPRLDFTQFQSGLFLHGRICSDIISYSPKLVYSIENPILNVTVALQSSMGNFYRLLGILKDASDNEIKAG